MMKLYRAYRAVFWLYCISFTVMADPILAQEEDVAAEPNYWKGSIQAGGVFNTGNSSTKTIHSKLTIDYEDGCWDNMFSVEGQFAADNSKTTAESILTNIEIRRLISEKLYWFIKAAFTYDRFAIYDYTLRDAVGLGYTLFRAETWSLSAEVGPGGSHSRIAGTKRMDHELIFNAGIILKKKISENADFKQTVNTNIGQLNTNIKSVSLIKTRMTKNLALEVSYTVEHNTRIPPGSSNRLRTDTISKVAVVYDF